MVLFLFSGSDLKNEIFAEGMVDGNDISIVSTICDGTTQDNADMSIETIQGISTVRSDPFFNAILNNQDLTSYEKIIILKTLIRKLKLENNVNDDTTLSSISSSTYSLHKYCKV
jgi:hypothetical protein